MRTRRYLGRRDGLETTSNYRRAYTGKKSGFVVFKVTKAMSTTADQQ